jgi:hypothetical protein
MELRHLWYFVATVEWKSSWAYSSQQVLIIDLAPISAWELGQDLVASPELGALARLF